MRSMKLFLLFFLAIICGCAPVQTRFFVSIDSLASPVAQSKKTYLLLPGNERVTWDDLQFQEYAIYLIRVLNAKGFVLADSAEEANLAIVLSYGIGDPQTNLYSYSLPTWGQTGIASSSTYGSATTFGNNSTFNAKTTHTPTYGVTGYKTYTGTRTTFFRYAIITAYDFEKFKETERQIQLWQTTITSTGSSGDLRRVFPILVGASVPYLGTNTGQKINVSMGENDTVIKAVKGIPSE